MKLLRLAIVAIGSMLVTSVAGEIEITTWSGNNCEGSSQVVTANGCSWDLPGGSFSTSTPLGNGQLTTWSGTDCRGSSQVYNFPDYGYSKPFCIPVPFGSISIIQQD